MHQEATKLQAFIQKAKEPKQQTGDKKSDKIHKNEFDHVTAIKSRQTVTVQDRVIIRLVIFLMKLEKNKLNLDRTELPHEL